MSLYVKLEVEYMTNPRLLDAGPLAELLYVRSLCFAKRTMRDGFLSSSQLNLITFGVPSAKKHIKSLVDNGLWEADKNGGYWITGWLERNKSAAQVESESERKRQASVLANHERWHVAENKKAPTCSLCYPESDPKADAKSHPTRRSTEPKTESEPEEEPETETESVVGSRSSSSNLSPATTPTTTESKDPRFETVVALIVEADIAEHGTNRRANPERYRSTCLNNLLRDRGPEIRQALAERPDATPEHVARLVRSSK